MKMDRKWKYNAEEIKKRFPKVKCPCLDCGVPYSTFPDMIVDAHLWEMINPTYEDGCGILCPKCMMNRFRQLCIYSVRAHFHNGNQDWK